MAVKTGKQKGQNEVITRGVPRSLDFYYGSKSGEDKFVADASHITYAPTNSCDYAGGGTFEYDSDGIGGVDTDPLTAIVSELMGVTDADTNGLLDEIEATGFVLPKR